jgi:SAM-dependent methyltransferase
MSRLTKLRALKWPTIAYEVQKNLRSRARGRRGTLQAITALGATLQAPAERVAYSRTAFESYRENGGLEAGELEGLRVLELGPGEDLCNALRFIAAGAAKVTCIDRFEFRVDPAWEQEVYRLLLDEVGEAGRRRLGPVLGADGTLNRDSPLLEVVRGVGIEAGAEHLGEAASDLIVSVAVLEHVYDLEASLRAMDRLLAPGGLMVHWVDLRDHGMFTNGGRHPLEFLTIGERTYHLMTSHAGAPNRERIGAYRALLDALGHEVDIKVANVGGAREDLDPYRHRIAVGAEIEESFASSIERLRPRLAPRFAELPVEELAATGIVIRSRKPSSSA